MNDITLTGKNIYIRTMTLDDTDSIISWRNSKQVMDNFIMQTPLTRQVHEAWYHNRIETGQVVQFVIGISDTHEEIGSVYLRDINHNDKSAEFGIFIGATGYEGQGYGQEALTLISQYAKDELNLVELKLRVRSKNVAARHIYEKAGFVKKHEEQTIIGDVKETIIFMSKEIN